MGLMENIVLFLLIVAGGAYVFLVATGTDNFSGINLHLDNMYKDIKSMTAAVITEMDKQGKKCELIKFDKNFPEFLIEGKKYYMTSRVIAIGGFPTQIIQLKKLK